MHLSEWPLPLLENSLPLHQSRFPLRQPRFPLRLPRLPLRQPKFPLLQRSLPLHNLLDILVCFSLEHIHWSPPLVRCALRLAQTPTRPVLDSFLFSSPAHGYLNGWFGRGDKSPPQLPHRPTLLDRWSSSCSSRRHPSIGRLFLLPLRWECRLRCYIHGIPGMLPKQAFLSRGAWRPSRVAV